MSTKWIAKAVLQKGISYLPRPQRVNHLFQKYVTGGTKLTEAFTLKRVEWAATHLDALERHDGRTTDYHAVELGSGWFPIVPLCLYLHGAAEVTLCDIDELGRPELTAQALDAVIALAESGELGTQLPAVRTDRIADLRSARAEVMQLGHRRTLERLGMTVQVGDARELHLARPADLISSNTVLEHIDPGVLVDILAAFRRNAVPGTVMSHLVDLCDHYAYVDPSLEVFNYLRFSERQWRWIDNSIQPMNRLRVHQYRDLYRRSGVEITEERRWDGDLAELAKVPLAAPFDAMDPADVACKAVLFVTRF